MSLLAGRGDSFTPLLYRRDRFECVASGGEVFCPELDPSKGMTWGVLKDRASGQAIVAFSTHFWWQARGIGDDWIRLDNARRLRARIAEIAARHHAVAIGGGDLNASLESWALKDFTENGLADAQATARISVRNFPTEHGNPVRGVDGRYRGIPGARAMNPVPPGSWYLDHIFYDKGRIRVEWFSPDASREACRTSDHHPIVADFKLK